MPLHRNRAHRQCSARSQWSPKPRSPQPHGRTAAAIPLASAPRRAAGDRLASLLIDLTWQPASRRLHACPIAAGPQETWAMPAVTGARTHLAATAAKRMRYPSPNPGKLTPTSMSSREPESVRLGDPAAAGGSSRIDARNACSPPVRAAVHRRRLLNERARDSCCRNNPPAVSHGAKLSTKDHNLGFAETYEAPVIPQEFANRCSSRFQQLEPRQRS